MDTVTASYEKVAIEVRLVELEKGGWKADFTLSGHTDSQIIPTPLSFAREGAFSTREAAKKDAIEEAHRIIDEARTKAQKESPRTMKTLLAMMALACTLGAAAVPTGATVFIEPTKDGFDVYFSKALETKKVPVKEVGHREDADFVILVTFADAKERGSNDYGGTIKVVGKDGSIAWSQVATKKGIFLGPRNMAEELANRLKKSIETGK